MWHVSQGVRNVLIALLASTVKGLVTRFGRVTVSRVFIVLVKQVARLQMMVWQELPAPLGKCINCHLFLPLPVLLLFLEGCQQQHYVFKLTNFAKRSWIV